MHAIPRNIATGGAGHTLKTQVKSGYPGLRLSKSNRECVSPIMQQLTTRLTKLKTISTEILLERNLLRNRAERKDLEMNVDHEAKENL